MFAALRPSTSTEMLKVVRAKLHGITVTDANLAYQGSVTIDPEFCDLAEIYPLEFVEIWNRTNGARIETYVIYGEPGSKCCILNGAAARTCQPGDDVIIAASEFIERKQLHDLKPKVVTFRPGNLVDKVHQYDVFESAQRTYDFRILEQDETGTATVIDPEAAGWKRA